MHVPVMALFVCCNLGALSACSVLRPPRTEKIIYYRVKPGDTLSNLGQRFHLSAEEIADANDISDPKSLQVATLLRMPYRDAPRAPQNVASAGSSTDGIGGIGSGNARASLKRIDIGQAKEHIGRLAWPVDLKTAHLSSRFGWRWFKFHEGIDLAAPEGTPVYAAHSGIVVYSGNSLRGYGNLIAIRGDGILTVYGHNKRNRVSVGERVRKGERIADLGSTGKSTGPHLHFETRIKNSAGKNAAVDPMIFLSDT